MLTLPPLIFLVIVSLVMVLIIFQPLLLQLQRNRISSRSFPKQWLGIINRNVAIYHHLDRDRQRELQGHVQIFLKEKQFIGCLGLVVTEEMRVTIAAIACFLLFNRRHTYFPNLRTILIYPNAYVVTETVSDGLVVQQRQTTRLGESWKRDQLVLAWAQIAQDIKQWQDGHNVVLHEFAHQLDQEEEPTEGVPILPRQSDFDLWAEVMSRAYLDLCDRLKRNKKTGINSYGATSPAEFFAVITETFFEKPTVLVKHYPDLYAVLQRYYHLNPVEWT